MPALAASMSLRGVFAWMIVDPIPTKLAIRSGLDVPLQERKHHHPSQAMSDPVHPVLPGVSLDVIEDGRHVVTDEVVDRPGRLAPFPERGLTQEPIDPVRRPGRAFSPDARMSKT